MDISVIMPAYLGDYDGAATDRVNKFTRAVDYFLQQHKTHSSISYELIVVSDGCDLVEPALRETAALRDLPGYYKHNIHFIKIPKQKKFSGHVRNIGIQNASGKIIAFLDSDDLIMPWHLTRILSGWHALIEDYNYSPDWVFFDDYIADGGGVFPGRLRTTSLVQGGIGTSCIAYLRSLNVQWTDGYGHDWNFVQSLIAKTNAYRKIKGPAYAVCHLPDRLDV